MQRGVSTSTALRARGALMLAVLVVSGALVRHNATATGGGPITKLAAYVLENHSQAAAYAGMPYLSSLAAQYAKATNYNGVTHPSEGNYITMFSGQGAATCGIADPKPGQCNQPGLTVFGQAIAAGRTAKLYQDGMSSNCSASGDYGHNPWLHFPAEAAQCAQFDVPMGTQSAGNLAGDINTGNLPNLSMVVPNDTNNSHSGPLSGADSYLHTWMNAIFAGPDWRSGHLAVVIVFDEGETTSDVAFVVVSPTVAAGTVFAGKADHNSLERLYATVAGIAPINGGVNATDLSGPFNFTASGSPPPGTTTAPTTSSTSKSTSATVQSTTVAPTLNRAPPRTTPVPSSKGSQPGGREPAGAASATPPVASASPSSGPSSSGQTPVRRTPSLNSDAGTDAGSDAAAGADGATSSALPPPHASDVRSAVLTSTTPTGTTTTVPGGSQRPWAAVAELAAAAAILEAVTLSGASIA